MVQTRGEFTVTEFIETVRRERPESMPKVKSVPLFPTCLLCYVSSCTFARVARVLKPDRPEYFLETRTNYKGQREKYIFPTSKNLVRWKARRTFHKIEPACLYGLIRSLSLVKNSVLSKSERTLYRSSDCALSMFLWHLSRIKPTWFHG